MLPVRIWELSGGHRVNYFSLPSPHWNVTTTINKSQPIRSLQSDYVLHWEGHVLALWGNNFHYQGTERYGIIMCVSVPLINCESFI